MLRMCAQGDILIERVGDVPEPLCVIALSNQGSLIIAEDEATGHHHRLSGSATIYRDDALARDIPAGLYVGHVQVSSPTP
jgi:hypothetical protein